MEMDAAKEENVGMQEIQTEEGQSRGPIGRTKFGARPLNPHVREWFHKFGLDWLSVAIIGVVALVVDKFMPDMGGQHRYFRLPAGSFVQARQWSEFDHPVRRQIISFWLSAGLNLAIPGLVIFSLQLCNRGSFVDGARAILGVLNSIITCCFIQVILKSFIGGFRPGFLETCKPIPDVFHERGRGYSKNFFRSNICTGDPEMVAWGLESFPSGHVATSFAAAVFLSLYINARLKVFADYRANPFLIIFCLFPLVLSTLMAGAISIDMSHHWYDILAGAILGILVAILGYRNAYAAVFDHRWNHVPLSSSRRMGRARKVRAEQEDYHVRFGFPRFVQDDSR